MGAGVYGTKWLTGVFDIIGQRVFNTQTLSVKSQQYLAPCATANYTVATDAPEPSSCDVFVAPNNVAAARNPFLFYNSAGVQLPSSPPTVSANSLVTTNQVSYNITNASIGAKVNLVKRLVLSVNVLVRLDDGGLHAKPSPLASLSYTF